MAENVAAELEQLRLQSPLIHELKPELMRPLCTILDSGDLWTEIAPMMPDIAPIDVEGCRKYSEQGSPSSFLLRIWASKGYCIVDLYNLFAMCRLVRCMQLIKSEVPDRFHFLEEFCTAATPRSAFPPPLNGVTGASLSARSILTSPSQPGTARGGASTITSTTTHTTNAKWNTDDDPLLSGMKNTPSVPYSDLVEATNNFDSANIIGKGGYGVVYKGIWKAAQIAVKRLSTRGVKLSGSAEKEEAERLKQSLQELNTLAKFRHDNILPVYLYSLDGPDGPCIVYKYMANGSLDDRLQCKKGTPPLTWTQKAIIAKGAAMALDFLHTITRLPLIHGDVKPANILLDKHLEPKLGDFGLSREGVSEVGVDDKTAFIASHVKGTLAYLPPEFISSKIFSTKLDVYAFGVVLLEMATGQRSYVEKRQPAILVDLARDLEGKMGGEERREGNKKRIWDGMKDGRTPDEGDDDGLSIFWSLWSTGIVCSRKDRFQRPQFKKIVEDLAID